MSTPEHPLPSTVNIEVPDDAVAGTYADFAGVWHTHDIFVLDFAALTGSPQVVDGPDGPVVQALGRVVSRVRIPPDQVFEVMKALEQQLSAWESETGRRPNRAAPDGPPTDG